MNSMISYFIIVLSIYMANFQYMRFPPELYRLKPKRINIQNQESQAVITNSSGKPLRVLFYKVPFNSEELSKIQEFKEYAKMNKKKLDCTDTEILRYLYSSSFDKKQCLEKITIFLDWIHDPAIQTLSNKARRILMEGACYTFGRDRKNRPIVFLDLSKIKLDRYELNEYYCALNSVLNIAVRECFVHGIIEQYLFVIDMGSKNFTSLPLEAIGSIIKKLSIVYSNYLGNLLVINTQSFVKFTYMALKYFIHQDTRKKITIIDSSEIEKIEQYVDKSQLMKKHSGNNPDPIEYWPPQVPGQKHMNSDEEQTIYYSVQYNQSIFLDQQFQKENSRAYRPFCCENQCQTFQSCSIF